MWEIEKAMSHIDEAMLAGGGSDARHRRSEVGHRKSDPVRRPTAESSRSGDEARRVTAR
jgi:hypothetical protein